MQKRLLALSIADAAEILEASEQEIIVWVTQGKIPLFDGLVEVYDSSNPDIEPGWKYETIEKLKPLVKEWQSEDNNDEGPLLAYDWRAATQELECTKPELMRWKDEGKLPCDGLVSSFYFTSMSWGHTTTTEGWSHDTIQKAKPYVEEWRSEHQEAMKSKQKARQKEQREKKKKLQQQENAA